MRCELLVQGGTVVTEDGEQRIDLAIDQGRVVAHIPPGTAVDAAGVLDADGLHVFPGAVDMAVHLHEPGRADWEGWASGSSAAAVGGTTTLLDLPLHNRPPTLDSVALAPRLQAAVGEALVDYALWGGVTPGNLDRLPALAAAGVVGLWGSLCDLGVPEMPPLDGAALATVLRQTSAADVLLGLQPEDEAVIAPLAAQQRAAGAGDPLAWADSRPPGAELAGVDLAQAAGRGRDARLPRQRQD
jgi:allantoinase